MPDRVPTLASYLARLPRGVESYPEVTVKASVYRDALESLSLDECLGDLPGAVAELVRHPLPVTAWVPEVHSLAILIAIRDRHFATTAAGLDSYEAWVFERNSRLLKRPLYRALFLLVSPERLLSGVERRWSAFRRGTSARLVEKAVGLAEIEISHPPHLYDRCVERGMCGAFRAAASAAGARDVHADVVSSTERVTRCRIRWS